MGERDELQRKLDMPCGSCHPCNNWASQTWENAGLMRPHVYEWQALVAERDAALAVVEAVRTIHRPIRVYDECEHDADHGCEPIEVYDYMACNESAIGWACSVCCYDDEMPIEGCPHGAVHNGVTREHACPTTEALAVLDAGA